MTIKTRHILCAVMAISLSTAACEQNKSGSVAPGDTPPGAGAGQRGGTNDGTAAGTANAGSGRAADYNSGKNGNVPAK
jgi:hypothetical protein